MPKQWAMWRQSGKDVTVQTHKVGLVLFHKARTTAQEHVPAQLIQENQQARTEADRANNGFILGGASRSGRQAVLRI